jgi:hypothetical protein
MASATSRRKRLKPPRRIPEKRRANVPAFFAAGARGGLMFISFLDFFEYSWC